MILRIPLWVVSVQVRQQIGCVAVCFTRTLLCFISCIYSWLQGHFKASCFQTQAAIFSSWKYMHQTTHAYSENGYAYTISAVLFHITSIIWCFSALLSPLYVRMLCTCSDFSSRCLHPSGAPTHLHLSHPYCSRRPYIPRIISRM